MKDEFKNENNEELDLILDFIIKMILHDDYDIKELENFIIEMKNKFK